MVQYHRFTRCQFIFTGLLLVPAFLFGGKREILFIGNSLTFFNNMPGMVQQMADSAGKSIEIHSMTQGGVSLRTLARSSLVHSKIEERLWDIIILQSDDITAFSDMYSIEVNMLNSLKERILAHHPATQIVYEMIWGLEEGVYIQGEGYYSYLDYITKIFDGTLYIAGATGMVIAPAGWAWKRALELDSHVRLFDFDHAHPSYQGSYLTACVFYSVLFGERVTGNRFMGRLEEDEALFFQSVASEIVLDYFHFWGQLTSVRSVGDCQPETCTLRSFPNPFNPRTNIVFEIAENTDVNLSVVDMLGRTVQTIVPGQRHSAGSHSIHWNGKTDAGQDAASGVYLLVLKAGEVRKTQKVMLVR